MMSALTKNKKKQKQQRDAIKRKRGKADGGRPDRQGSAESRARAGTSGDSEGRLARSTRNLQQSEPSPSQVQTRQRRAAVANGRQESRSPYTSKVTRGSDGQISLGKSKTPLLQGRTLFAVEVEGKKRFLPLQRDASATELRAGFFIPSSSDYESRVSLKLTNGKMESKTPFLQGRTLFAVEMNGKKQFAPLERDATQAELRAGFFVPEDEQTLKAVMVSPVDFQKPEGNVKPVRFDPLRDKRPLFAVNLAQGEKTEIISYLPLQRQATAQELSEGRYIPNKQQSKFIADSQRTEVSNKPIRYDEAARRILFPTQVAGGAGGVEYLPRKTEANALELAEGRYIEDSLVRDRSILGAVNPIGKGKVYEERDKGNNLRKLYPIAVQGRRFPVYLPQRSDATAEEVAKGLYIPDTTVEAYERRKARTALKDRAADRALRRDQRARQQPGGVIFRE